MADDRNKDLPWIIGLALALNVFAILAVNFWVYNARWWYIEIKTSYQGLPPTVSRAISLDEIGDPFSIWITASGLCMIVGIGILSWDYFKMRHIFVRPTKLLRIAAWVVLPGLVFFQVFSAMGMNILSVYRFPNFNKQHMVEVLDSLF